MVGHRNDAWIRNLYSRSLAYGHYGLSLMPINLNRIFRKIESIEKTEQRDSRQFV